MAIKTEKYKLAGGPLTKIPLKKDCFVTSMALMALRKLGPESLEWDPLILRDAFEAVYRLEKLPQKSFDKLNCGYALIGTDTYTSTIEGFLSATAVMCGIPFESDTVPFCTLENCAWGVWEYMNLLGDMDEANRPTETFCPEIVEYIQQAGALNGVTRFPVWLEFANRDMKMPDMSEDAELFEMYNARQDDYIEHLNLYVTARQDRLAAELKELQSAGIIGP